MARARPTNNDVALSKTISTAAMFLDYPSLQHLPSATNATISPELRDYVVGGSRPQQIITTFVDVIYPWMPFMPPRKLRSMQSVPTNQMNGEDVFLLACIKNLTQPLTDDNPSTKQYLAIKSAFVSAEVGGTLTVPLLQSLVLLLLYEFGHGIYPSAYTTLGTCIRYLTALGIEEAGPSISKPQSWIEIETRRRLWWAVYVMER